MRMHPCLIACVFLLLGMTSTISQETERRSEERRSQGRFQGRGGGSVPGKGTEILDLTIADEDGNPFALKERFIGKHTVLVFGCLT